MNELFFRVGIEAPSWKWFGCQGHAAANATGNMDSGRQGGAQDFKPGRANPLESAPDCQASAKMDPYPPVGPA
jgi:hypothetical protein